MTLEPLRRHPGEEQRLYRPHPKYGANRALHRPGFGRGARRRGASAEGIHLARRARRANRGNENPDAESALRSLGQERLLRGHRIPGPVTGEARSIPSDPERRPPRSIFSQRLNAKRFA